MKIFTMPIFAALIIPAFSYVPAAPPAGRESNRDTQLCRYRSPKLFEHGRHALGNIVQPGFAGLVQLSLHDQPHVQGRD